LSVTRNRDNQPDVRVDLRWESDMSDRVITARAKVNDLRFEGRTFELLLREDGDVLRVSIEVDQDRIDVDAITSRQLREVPLGAIAQQVRKVVLVDGLAVFDAAGFHPSPAMQRHAEVTVENRRPRRRRRNDLTDGFLAQVASAYLAAAVRDPATSLEVVGRTFGYSPDTVRAFRDKARARKLYRSNGRGRPGGQMTAKGLAALAEDDTDE
jgi:hypothetical protein